MTASTSTGDIDETSSGDTATTFSPLLSKEKAFPTVASLRSTPRMFIFPQRSENVSLSIEPEYVPAIMPSIIRGNAYLRAIRDSRDAIPIDASSELPSTSSITRCGCHSYMLRKRVHTTKLVQETTKRKQKRTKSDRAVWIFAKDSLHSIGKQGNRRLGLLRRRLRFQESLSKESRQSRVPGLSLPGLPSNFFFQPLQLVFRNLIHVVVQGGDYARSESCEQPIDKPFDDPTLHLVLRIKPVNVSGPSSSNGLVPGQNTLLEQPI